MSSFQAQYSGNCAVCGTRFTAGTEVAYVDDQIVEASCLDGVVLYWRGPVERPVDRTKLCPSCFTMHGAGQVECS